MCDRTDEQLYDLEFKHTKSQKEEEELQKRITDIKCKFFPSRFFLGLIFYEFRKHSDLNRDQKPHQGLFSS